MPKRVELHGEPSSKNVAIAHLFDLMADVLEIRGANVFRVRAYRRAAQSLRSLSADVAAVAREHGLEGIPGIGADLAHKIVEYLETGRIADIEAARQQIPAGV